MTSPAVKFEPETAKSLTEQVIALSGQNLLACYQCKRCAAGCPVAEETDNFTPNKLIRMIILGEGEKALNNELVWRCVSCYTCGTRCPNNIHTARITETLKKMAKKGHAKVLRPRVANFHKSFIDSAVRWGRLNEGEFVGCYELKNTFSFLKKLDFVALFKEHLTQAKLGIKMLKKKRLHFGFQSSKGRSEIKKLLKKAERKAGL